MIPHTDDIVVLRRVEYGDSDLIITALARQAGIVSALARGARRSKKRFGGGLGLFGVARATLVKRPRRELWELSSTELETSFDALAIDVAAMAHASYGTELVRELVAPEQSEPEVFALLLELYRTLAEVGASPPALRSFELRLLAALGLAPVLTRCIRCDYALAMGEGEGASLDARWGGVACRRCAPEGAGKPLDPAARALLVAAAELPLGRAAADLGAIRGDAARQARDAMVSLVLGHVGRPLRSLEFIAKLRGGGPRARCADEDSSGAR